jgi:hypothetical protein
MFWPSEDSSLVSNLSRVLSFGLLWPFMLYGAVMAMLRAPDATRNFSRPKTVLILFTIIYTGIHLFSWALIRYRLPVDAVLIVFGAYGLVDLAGRIVARRSAPALT